MARTLGFAHRGAPATPGADNTLAAFRRALDLGATALESDVLLTADHVPVLAHRPLTVRRGRRVSSLLRSELPAEIPSLEDLYQTCGTKFDLALDMSDPGAAEEVVRMANLYGVANRLWLTYWHLDTLARWRRTWPSVRLVYPTLPVRPGGLDRIAQQLQNAGVDCLNLHHLACRARARDCTAAHGVLLFAWGVRTARPLLRLLDLPVDGVFCDDVPAMVAALNSRRF